MVETITLRKINWIGHIIRGDGLIKKVTGRENGGLEKTK